MAAMRRPHCDVLASKTMDHSPNSRMCYFRTFHKMVGANPFIWGGNFNTDVIDVSSLMEGIDKRYMIRQDGTSSAEQPGMQVVFPHRFRQRDLALTFGLSMPHKSTLKSEVSTVVRVLNTKWSSPTA